MVQGQDSDTMAASGDAVPMVEAETVQALRVLAGRGWGARAIARELGVSRNTVRRYLRGGESAERQERPGRRILDLDARAVAKQMFTGVAEGNAVVVKRELQRAGVEVGVRTVQRVVRDERLARRAQELATVRYERGPGEQMQIDFGEKLVTIGGEPVRTYLFVAVLSYSRRIFVKAFLRQRQDDWREGLACAFRHFGGTTQEVLIDNARALVTEHDVQTRTVRLAPGFASFCRDWGVTPHACAPYRARTKGKTEAGVKYGKRNALAGRSFESFAHLAEHLLEWMYEADRRVHGTTGERPIDRFDQQERVALRPLPTNPLAMREQRHRRTVGNDALVAVDGVFYSVPHRLVRERVDVALGDDRVRIFRGGVLVADHARSLEPRARVVDPAHWEGLWRKHDSPPTSQASTAPTSLVRDLSVYANHIAHAGES
jgi:transposase